MNLRHRSAITVGLVGAAAIALFWLTHDGPGIANDTSRLATAQALVESGSFVIDGTYFDYTVDKIKIDGNFYSDKPPLFSIYLAGLYGVMNSAFGWAMAEDLGSIYFWMTLLSSGLAFVLTLLGVRRLGEQLGAGPVTAAAVAIAACGATLMLPYSTVISSHAAAAPFLTWFAVHLFEGLAPPDASTASEAPGASRTRAFGTGLLGSMAALVEPATAPFVVCPAVAAASFGRRQSRWPWLFAGGVLVFLPHAVITYQIAGNPLLLNIDPSHFEYAGSMHDSQNLSGIGWAHDSVADTLRYAFHSLVGYRGALLYNMPAAVGAGFLIWKSATESSPRRRLFLGVLVAALLFFALTIGFTSNYSGWAYGIRWHATPAPLMSAFAVVGLAAESRTVRRAATAALGGAFLIGVPLTGLGTLDPWTPSTHREYSLVEVVSDRSVYIREHTEAAIQRLRSGHYFEARYQAEHIIRRAPDEPKGWDLAIAASAELGDLARLRHYRRRLTSGELPLSERLGRAFIRRIDRLRDTLEHR